MNSTTPFQNLYNAAAAVLRGWLSRLSPGPVRADFVDKLGFRVAASPRFQRNFNVISVLSWRLCEISARGFNLTAAAQFGGGKIEFAETTGLYEKQDRQLLWGRVWPPY